MKRRGDIVARGLAAATAVMAVLTLGSAQAQEWTGNGFVSISGGGQFGDRQFEANLSVPKFDEIAEFETDHALSGGGILDVAGGLRVWRNLAFAVGFSVQESSDEITGSGSVPNPLFFDRPRAVTFAETGLKHREVGIHFSAVYVIPVSDRFTVSLFGGPTIFRVRQDPVSSIVLGPETDAPLFETVTVASVGTSSVDETGGGGHLGFDGTFLLNDQLGVGGFFRYAGGSVDLPTGNSMTSLDVGGAQVGGGLRVFF